MKTNPFKVGINVLITLVIVYTRHTNLYAQADADTADSGWGAYPIFFYTDQTKLGFGVFGIHFFKHQDAKYMSNLNTILVYTLRKQIILELSGELYWQNRRLTGTINYAKFPDTYYGIGNASKTADAEDFTDEGASLFLNLQQQLFPDVYAGITYSFVSHALVETEPDGVLKTGVLPGTSEAFLLSGPGLSLNYDTRDNVNYPSSGSFMQFLWNYYTKTLASDFTFVRYMLDLRHFLAWTHRGVLAMQGTWNRVTSGAPILEYPVLGDDRLRGFSARYWDKNLLTFQVEYRKMLWGYLGIVLFAGMGDVVDELKYFKANSLKYGVGFGLRYMVLPAAKMTLRIDFGFGTDENSSLTFMAGEAF